MNNQFLFTKNSLRYQSYILSLLLLLTVRGYSQDILSKVLPSIVIIDSDTITYTSPYEQQSNSNFFFPLDFNSNKSNKLQGEGIVHKNLFGSGIFLRKIDSTYYILTNNHIIKNSTKIWVTTHDGTIHEATLEGADPHRDIALISITTDKIYPLITTNTTQQLQIGIPVYVIGSPYGFTFSVSKGIISAFNRTDSSLENIFIQTDATMNPGNSGGALINEKGELIGISTWIYSPKSLASIGLNFASSIDIALYITEHILHNVPLNHGWIGIIYDSFSPTTLSDMNIHYRFGSIITNIVHGSPAYNSKLQIGDIIISLNNQKIHAFNSSLNNTTALISTLGANKTIDLLIIRNNTTQKIQTTTISAPNLEYENNLISSQIWPGMTVIPLENYKKELLGLENSLYVLVVEHIIPNTPAHKSEIVSDNIITKINGNFIKNYADYLYAINNALQYKTNIVFELFTLGEYKEITLTWD